MVLLSAVDCSEFVRLLAETGKRNAIYMMAIDRLSASPLTRFATSL